MMNPREDVRPQVDVSQHFDGRRHFSFGRWLFYTNPTLTDVEEAALSSKEYRHRDILNRITYRPKDVLRYISPTYGKPFHIVVQATNAALNNPAPDWRRVKVRGHAPVLLKISAWAVKGVSGKGKGEYTWQDVGLVALKVLAVIPLQFLMLCIPMGTRTGTQIFYKGLPARSWEYPKYARNELDAGPNDAATGLTWRNSVHQFGGEHGRLLRPKKLVVKRNGNWSVEHAPANMPYVLVSYTRTHFNPADPRSSEPLYQIAIKVTEDAGLRAYWLDYLCIEQKEGKERSDDIHRLCDVIRGAAQVCVALPSLEPAHLCEWGSRMWTLNEALLADNKTDLKFCDVEGATVKKSKISLADMVWNQDQAGRLLAEHFTGMLTLSRLELISLGIEALSLRHTNKKMEGDMAYALMGLMGHRPIASPFDSQFQALARLSLANDSDRIVERMICMLPDTDNNGSLTNGKFVLKDKLGAKLWDIEPLCQVAGVCEGDALILDGCRGASIRWKDIPSIATTRRRSYKRLAAATILRSGPLWVIMGAVLASIGAGVKALGVIILLIGLVLLLSSSWSIMLLYGGKVWGAEAWLIGFEGTLPIREIERLTFGNATGRFSYAPSSSRLAEKHEHERIGKGPAWIEGREKAPSLPSGHRLFTLIDTGTMHVSVFSAKKPPSVALIAGREGGMLRTVLCHYDRATATLRKETVLRMETPMLDKAGLLGWVKVA